MFSGRGEKERKREQVRDVRWAAPQGRASEAPYYFSLKQIAGQTAPLTIAHFYTRVDTSLVAS